MSYSWQNCVANSLEEDIGSGDITSQLTVDEAIEARATFTAKQDLVLAGTEVLTHLFPGIELLAKDGDLLKPGDAIARVHGKARQLLSLERTSLNFLQRLSGVATLGRKYVDAVAGTKCKILDTRKTTPGLRILEKNAAAAGGVTNHRIGLYDGVLIKNNHITAAGGVRAALAQAKNSPVPVEIEVRTFDELDEALDCGAKHLLLDNLTPEEARRWIAHINSRATSEISGNVNLATIRAYAETGADYISVGAITHSASAVDINLRLELL